MARKRFSEPEPPVPKEFTLDDIERGVAKLRRRIEDLRKLDSEKIPYNSVAVDLVESNIRNAIREAFGPESPQEREHRYFKIGKGRTNVMDDDAVLQHRFAAGIPEAITLLEGLVAVLEEEGRDLLGRRGPSEAARTFAELLADFQGLLSTSSKFSLSNVSTAIYPIIRPVDVPPQTDRCTALWNFYWTLRSITERLPTIDPPLLEELASGFNAVLREFESIAGALVRTIGYAEDRSQSAFQDFVELAQRYNAFVERWERLLKEIPGAALTFSRLRSLGDIPVTARPELPAEKAYAAGEAFDLYKDLRKIIASARTEVFLVEPYPDKEIFELYLEDVAPSVAIRLLVNDPKKQFTPVASMFAVKPGRALEVRQSSSVHDRMIFVDGACYVLGQSVKDAAVKKPTYIVKIEGAGAASKALYDGIWQKSAPVHKTP